MSYPIHIHTLCGVVALTASHLSDGAQQLAIGVENNAEWQEQAEGKKADDVGDIVCGLGPPVHWAGGAWTFWPITAPAYQGRHCPGYRVEPREADSSQHGAVVSATGYSGRNHGAVTFIGQDSEGDEGDDAWEGGRGVKEK